VTAREQPVPPARQPHADGATTGQHDVRIDVRAGRAKTQEPPSGSAWTRADPESSEAPREEELLASGWHDLARSALVVELVISSTTGDRVRASPAREDVCTAASEQSVAAAATAELVVAASAIEEVIAAATVEQVGSRVADEPIIARAALKVLGCAHVVLFAGLTRVGIDACANGNRLRALPVADGVHARAAVQRIRAGRRTCSRTVAVAVAQRVVTVTAVELVVAPASVEQIAFRRSQAILLVASEQYVVARPAKSASKLWSPPWSWSFPLPPLSVLQQADP
jgi:hypothetical protein